MAHADQHDWQGHRRFLFLNQLLLLCAPLCSNSDEVASVSINGGAILIQAGRDTHSSLSEAAFRLLHKYNISRANEPAVVITLGNASESRLLIPDYDIQNLKSADSFIIRSGVSKSSSSTLVFACAGKTARGTSYAFYELLQLWGFSFMHPLKPTIPDSLPFPLLTLALVEEPRWEVRGTHYHTQHPLELTNLLNGYDSDGGHNDRKSWAALLPEWEAFLDWMLAQKQNYVEWMLLTDTKVARAWEADRNQSFDMSDERRTRLQKLVDLAHRRGLEVGIDAPLTLQQQHSFSLLPSPSGYRLTDDEEVRIRVQWLLDLGLDHLGTELGATEFTRGLSAKDLVDILSKVKSQIGPARKLFVKNHCSTKQHADGFDDPRSSRAGTPLNFNYLSYYADPTIVAMPHTVQIYSLTDPAPTYGNIDFSDLRNWTHFLLSKGRPVVFYPETAYWVNYDINVPLFLAPAYSNTRVRDANDIDEMVGTKEVVGQINFESGWQWGYWLANAVQALVAWQKAPDVLSVFRKLLRPMGSPIREHIVNLLHEYAEAQTSLLIHGISDTLTPPGIDDGALAGISYIQGSEGLSDLGGLMARYFDLGAPQPDRLRFVDLWTSQPLLHLGISVGFSSVGADSATVPLRRKWYRSHLRPLLANMNTTFSKLAKRFESLPPVALPMQELLKDLFVSAKLLGLRCSQVLALYDHAADCGAQEDSAPFGHVNWCNDKLNIARESLKEALSLVPDRELHYGLSDSKIHRVSGWRAEAPNPTAYNFGYLWAVRNLFYWQRDQAIVEKRIYSPCYGNINDGVQLGMQGGGGRVVHRLRDFVHGLMSNRLWKIAFADCLVVSKNEPSPLGMFQHSVSGSGTVQV